MNADLPAILDLPFELLSIITQYVADPCDLLALRRSCSTFNNLFKQRFDSTFRSRPCMRSSTLDKLLYWAATHNYERFVGRTARRVDWSNPEGPTMLRNGDRSTLSNGGVAQAMYQAVRGGHFDMFKYQLTPLAFRGLGWFGNTLERECFDVAVSEGNSDFLVQTIDEISSEHLVLETVVEGKSGLVLLMETHNFELVEHFLSYPISLGSLGNALMAYARSLEGHREGWCQRILTAVLTSALDPIWVFGGRAIMCDDVWHVDSRMLLDSLRVAGKRKCEAECSVWDGADMEIGLQEVEYDLRVISGEVL